jgi:hypothetical protein
MTEKLEIVRGSDNPFEDIGLPEPDTKLLKAEIIRILRERNMTGVQAAEATGFLGIRHFPNSQYRPGTLHQRQACDHPQPSRS